MTPAIARLLGAALVLSGCSEVLGPADPVQRADAGAAESASPPSETSCSTHADCNDRWDGPYLCSRASRLI